MSAEDGEEAPQAAEIPSDAALAATATGVRRRALRPSSHELAPSPLWPALAAALAGSSVAWAQGTIRIVSAALLLSSLILLIGGANLIVAGYNLAHAPGACQTALRQVRERQAHASRRSALSPAAQACLAGYACLAVSLSLGLSLALRSNLLIVPLGLLGLVAALTYRLPRYAWADRPWAELAALLLLGPLIVCAADLAQTRTIQSLALSLSIPIGLLAAATLFSDHFRLLDADPATRPRALPIYLNLRRARLVLALLIALAYLWVTIVGSRHGLHGVLIAWFSLPAAAVALTSAFFAAAPRARALVVRDVARLHLAFTLWLTMGVLLDGLVPWLIAHWPHLPLL
jgi:1,4-dihydroxy-2-naphthoate octaprenyltransferase